MRSRHLLRRGALRARLRRAGANKHWSNSACFDPGRGAAAWRARARGAPRALTTHSDVRLAVLCLAAAAVRRVRVAFWVAAPLRVHMFKIAQCALCDRSGAAPQAVGARRLGRPASRRALGMAAPLDRQAPDCERCRAGSGMLHASPEAPPPARSSQQHAPRKRGRNALDADARASCVLDRASACGTAGEHAPQRQVRTASAHAFVAQIRRVP